MGIDVKAPPYGEIWKRMRRSIVILIVVCGALGLAGCQPTPNDHIVSSKVGFEEAFEQSETSLDVRNTYEAPQEWEEVVVMNDFLSINIDAQVVVPDERH